MQGQQNIVPYPANVTALDDAKQSKVEDDLQLHMLVKSIRNENYCRNCK